MKCVNVHTVAASIAGANSQMSRVVLMGMLAMMLAVGLLLQRIYGWKLILRKLMVKNLLARRLLQVTRPPP